MKIYFTLKSIPELSDLPKDERQRLWRKHAFKAYRHWQTWIGFVSYATIMIAGCILSLRIRPWIPFGYAVAGAIFGAGFWIFFQFWFPVVRIYLKEERNSGRSSRTTVSYETFAKSPQAQTLYRPYTVALLLVGVFAFIRIAIEIFLIPDLPGGSQFPTYLIVILFHTYIILGCWITVFLRIKRSPYALLATRAISIISILSVPFGTAAFIYWIWRVRKRETP